jgi:hypothetical protein
VPVNGRQLSICHYELAEYRAIADEETKDKLGFQRFKQLNYNNSQWNEIASRDEFYFKITQLLQTLPFQQKFGGMANQQQRQGGSYQRPNNQPYNNQNRRQDNRPQNTGGNPHMNKGMPPSGGQGGNSNYQNNGGRPQGQY